MAFRNEVVAATNDYFRERVTGFDSPFYEGNILKCISPIQRLKWDGVQYDWKILANNGDNIRLLSNPVKAEIHTLVTEGLDFSNYCDDLYKLSGEYSYLKAETFEGVEFTAIFLTEESEASRLSLIKIAQNKLRSNSGLSSKQKKQIKKSLQWLYRLGDKGQDLYCSTVHKSQGTTLNTCVVNVLDLLKKPRQAKSDIRPSLLYTAYSRASENLYLLDD